MPESEAGDPDEIIREAARLLELGDRAGLTKLYVKAPRIPRTLDALDDLALKRIAAAYRTARLVRSLEHLRVYEFDFVLPNGESRRTEVMVGRLVTGEWRLRNL